MLETELIVSVNIRFDEYRQTSLGYSACLALL